MEQNDLTSYYDIVVMLAFGINKDVNGAFPFSNDDVATFRYNISGDNPFEPFRLKAAKRIVEENITKTLLLVGGSVKGIPEVSKPAVMKELLINKYSVPSFKIETLVSEANTEGNAHTVRDYLIKNQLFPHNVGILSNYYHLVRAHKLFARSFSRREQTRSISIEPICAESLLLPKGSESINDFYKKPETTGIIIREIQGMMQMEDGTYKSGVS